MGAGEEIQHETDRARFLGRGGTVANPAMLRTALSGSDGTVLDPIFSSRCRVTLQPRERKEITFLIAAASSRDQVLSLAAKYQHPEAVERAFEMAWTRAQLQFRYLGITPAAGHRFQELAGHLVFPNPRMRASQDRFSSRSESGQAALWAHGISGDLPILSVTVSDAPCQLPLVLGVATGAYLLAAARTARGSGHSESGKPQLRPALRAAAPAADRGALGGDRRGYTRRRFSA